jgi:hypothetical protein
MCGRVETGRIREDEQLDIRLIGTSSTAGQEGQLLHRPCREGVYGDLYGDQKGNMMRESLSEPDRRWSKGTRVLAIEWHWHHQAMLLFSSSSVTKTGGFKPVAGTSAFWRFSPSKYSVYCLRQRAHIIAIALLEVQFLFLSTASCIEISWSCNPGRTKQSAEGPPTATKKPPRKSKQIARRRTRK